MAEVPYEERTLLKKVTVYSGSIFNGLTFYMLFMATMCVLTIFNPMFSQFLLIDVFRIIDMAGNILIAVARTWRQLIAGIFIFVMLNYIFAFLLYVLYSSTYAPAC